MDRSHTASAKAAKPRWKTLKQQVPPHTCPTIDVLYEYLQSTGAPSWTTETLDQIRRDNVQLRAVSKDALRELKKWETGVLPK